MFIIRRAEPWIGDSAYIDCEERDVVDACGEVREEVADPLAALAVLLELPARLDDPALVLVPAAAEGLDRDRLVVLADQPRLVVERVDVARPAVAEDEDDRLRLRRRSAASSGPSD